MVSLRARVRSLPKDSVHASVDRVVRPVRSRARRAASGPGPQGGPGGFGGRGGGFIGRGRGGSALQGSANYNFGGSALDASPYPLRANSQTDPTYARNQFGATIGGPLRIPGVYDGARTTFFVNYAGGRSDNLVDQYATVPTEAMRNGNFSSLTVGPLDPITGAPFLGGQIPQGRLDPSALALLNFFPLPNLPGTTQNYRRSVAALSTSDQFNARVTHNFSGTPGRRGGAGGGGRGAGGFGRGAAARAEVDPVRPLSSTHKCNTAGTSVTSSTCSRCSAGPITDRRGRCPCR